MLNRLVSKEERTEDEYKKKSRRISGEDRGRTFSSDQYRAEGSKELGTNEKVSTVRTTN